jgi:hypothetical protein
MACFEVHKEMGNGYPEDVYQERLELEPATAAFRLSHNQNYQSTTKAVKTLLPEHEAQLLNYLKATGRKVGYLVNFGTYPKLDWRRRMR